MLLRQARIGLLKVLIRADDCVALHTVVGDARHVLVVIAFRDADGDLYGVNAWPATGADLRFYRG